MKNKFLFRIIWLAMILLIASAGCSQSTPPLDVNSEPVPQNTAVDELTPRSDTEAVKEVGNRYLEAWKSENYKRMHALLTSLSQDALPEDEFVDHYNGIANEAALQGVDYEVLSVLVNPDSAQIKYRVVLHSVLVGDIERETLMNLRLEGSDWRIEWDDTLVLPELKGGNYLVMNRSGYIPARANIYDRSGLALVAQSDATAVGFLPDEVDPASAEQLFATLSEVTGVSVEEIHSQYTNAPSGAGWYIPLGEVSAEVISNQYSALSSFPGIRMQPYKSRYYFDGGIASHVLGYVSAIQPEEVDEYLRLGYQQDERVGQSGIEKWGESYLAGKRGGALYVFNAQGQPVTRLAESSAAPSQAIHLTIDRDFQVAAQQAIANFRGAIVILERDSGKVLVMVSSPGFDPNAFEPINYNSSQQRSFISSDPNQPLLNRATQGQYPLGSVFKIITMAAALETGVYSPDTTYQCGYFFDELPGARLNDWTYEYFLQNGKTIPSGLLTLTEGLMRSCNPFFWHIGLDLYNQGFTTAVSDMARGFGLDHPTGIIGLDEASGLIPDPSTQVDAVNMAIGQGDVLVTPLQVASFVAAIGNGGKIHQPQLVEKITQQDGKTTNEFMPVVTANLPLAAQNLQTIQQAMVGVLRNEKPRGTAWHVFTGLDVPVAGKTGTAQSANGAPHAWFAGYTFADQPDRPDIAGVVLIENVGEGSDYAAPVFRRIVELYFSGQPQKLYWWESSFNVPITDTVTIEGSPIPFTGTPSFPLSSFMRGLVIRSQSGFFTVKNPLDGLEVPCRLRGRLLKGRRSGDVVAVGDWVEFTKSAELSGMIDAVEPRINQISRLAPDPKGEYEQILIANPDQIVLVFACSEPEARLGMLDRYLVIAEKNKVPALIIANKIDLVGLEQAESIFSIYPQIGYKVIYTSTKTKIGVEAVIEQLTGKISLFTGPSGVGKSSLLNTIHPEFGLLVKHVSQATNKGRHTTVVRELFALPQGGYVADTPGLKALALWDIKPEELDGYFPEFRNLVADCQFNDCSHIHEPGCAIQQALESGAISPSRYRSYLHMRVGEE